ncbi:MAG: ABC transporter permease [Chromatiales bacterium]
MTRALAAIVGRELTRMVRQRGRLVSAMVRPLIWLFIIGSGFQAMLSGMAGGEYKQFMVPGLLCMVLLFGAMLASLSLVYDKESGVMRMLIIAPFPHYWIILARTVSAAIAGMAQALMLIVILALIGYFSMPAHSGLFLVALVITAFTCAATGMLIAVYSRTLDNFAVIMNFVIFPMFFLSGALYPIQHLPSYLKVVALVNPFSYGVDLMKHALLRDAPERFGADLTVGIDLAVLMGFIIIGLMVACLRFSQAPVFEKLAKVLSGAREA